MRVRLAEIAPVDLSVFDFDYDLTFIVFFMNADEQVYGRFGGRDAKSAEDRMSLSGLRYAMEAALKTHQQAESARAADKVKEEEASYIRQYAAARRYRGCIHCHQAKEILQSESQRTGKWNRQMTWRYPPPENVGLVLDVDRGNTVKEVVPNSSAAKIGLRPGDQLKTIGGVSINSFADAQFALDGAPWEGQAEIAYARDGDTRQAQLALPPGWRKSDVSWRPSLRDMVPYLPLHGSDLTAEEKRALGLKENQLAYRQRDPAPDRVVRAGIRAGDIILGIDKQEFTEMTASDFRAYIRRHYLVEDTANIEILRDGQRHSVPFKLTN